MYLIVQCRYCAIIRSLVARSEGFPSIYSSSNMGRYFVGERSVMLGPVIVFQCIWYCQALLEEPVPAAVRKSLGTPARGPSALAEVPFTYSANRKSFDFEVPSGSGQRTFVTHLWGCVCVFI